MPQRDESPSARQFRIEHLRRLAYWLDEGIRVPGTTLRFGLDPIIGLIPGAGDTAGAMMATAILTEAVRRGIPRAALVRISANIILDAALGAVPVVGDVFDVAWKANTRNLALLERHLVEPSKAVKADRTFVMLLGGVTIALLAAIVIGGGYLAVQLLQELAKLAR